MTRLTGLLAMGRQQGFAVLMKHVRLVALRRFHHFCFDRRYEAIESVPTGGYLLQDDLDPADPGNLSQAREYLPSPRLVVNWLLQGLGEEYSDFSFVDFGSGRGRVLLAAAEKPFRNVLGVEFSTRLHNEAERNIADYPRERLKSGTVRSVCMDAARFDLPDGDCILYFFNPFGAELLERVIERSLDQAGAGTRRIIVILYNPVHLETVAANPRLRLRPMSYVDQMKMRVFSPYPAAIFDFVDGATNSMNPGKTGHLQPRREFVGSV